MECSLKKFDGTVSNKRSRGQRDLPPFSSRSAAGKWRKSWIHSTIFETEKAREGFFRVRWQAASLGGGSGRIIAAPHGTEGASYHSSSKGICCRFPADLGRERRKSGVSRMREDSTIFEYEKDTMAFSVSIRKPTAFGAVGAG